MVFPYYERLSARKQAIYRRSDAVPEIALPQAALLHDVVGLLRQALLADQRVAVEAAAQTLVRGLCSMLGAPPVAVCVRAVRPSSRYGELHGLYTLRPAGRAASAQASSSPVATIEVWMRTAHHRRVVAFRTFLRTLLHEVCHHLDYHHLRLPDSLHTEGFFKREASLFRQLVPEAEAAPARARRASPGG